MDNVGIHQHGDCLFYSDAPVAAQERFQKGLVLAQQQEDPFGHAWAYTCLGRVYRASYERTVAAARDQLGAAAYAAAWAAGSMLTLEQALDLALTVADTSAETQ